MNIISNIPGISGRTVLKKTVLNLHKKLLLFTLILVMLFSFTTSVFAITAEEEKADADTANLYIRYFSLYSPGNSVLEQKTALEMIEELQKTDKWAAYYNPQEYALFTMSTSGAIFGIGIHFEIIEGRLTVVSVMPDSPAHKAGIQPEDIITHIEGKDIFGMSSNDIQALLLGAEGTSVNLQISSNGVSKQLVLERALLQLNTVAWEMLEENIAHIIISSFNANTGNEFLAAVYDSMSFGAQGIILDLRYCPGGLVDSALEVASMFIQNGATIFIQEASQIYFYEPVKRTQVTLPMVVLVNEYTASAAELLAADIQDISRALIVGTQTYGKGLVQSVIPLPSGAGISFTTGRYLSRGYQNIDASGGVFPDVYVADFEKQMPRAIELLKLQIKSVSTIIFTLGSNIMQADGVDKAMPAPTFIKNDSMYIPLRQVMETLGWEVYWNDGYVYLISEQGRIIIDLRANTVTKNKLVIDSDIILQNDTTYIPISMMKSMFDYSYIWTQETSTVTISR